MKMIDEKDKLLDLTGKEFSKIMERKLEAQRFTLKEELDEIDRKNKIEYLKKEAEIKRVKKELEEHWKKIIDAI